MSEAQWSSMPNSTFELQEVEREVVATAHQRLDRLIADLRAAGYMDRVIEANPILRESSEFVQLLRHGGSAIVRVGPDAYSATFGPMQVYPESPVNISWPLAIP